MNITRIPLDPFQIARIVNSMLIPKLTYLLSILPWKKATIIKNGY